MMGYQHSQKHPVHLQPNEEQRAVNAALFNLVQTLNQTVIQKQEGDGDEDDTIQI